MATIPFRQVLIGGMVRPLPITRPENIGQKAQLILDYGFVFECEMLAMDELSFSIKDEFEVYDARFCKNGPDVLPTVDDMIMSFDLAEACSERRTFSQ